MSSSICLGKCLFLWIFTFFYWSHIFRESTTISSLNKQKHAYLNNSSSEKGFMGTVVNRILPSFHGSHEIALLTGPLDLIRIFIKFLDCRPTCSVVNCKYVLLMVRCFKLKLYWKHMLYMATRVIWYTLRIRSINSSIIFNASKLSCWG